MKSDIVKHNFETAHRLPMIGGKCHNLHGHSWWATISLTGEPDRNGVIIDFGEAKQRIRRWIDERLDHGTMLGAEDPLLVALEAEDCKVFAFGRDNNGLTSDEWPTVEAVAVLLTAVCCQLFDDRPVTVERVHIQETHLNAAEDRA